MAALLIPKMLLSGITIKKDNNVINNEKPLAYSVKCVVSKQKHSLAPHKAKSKELGVSLNDYMLSHCTASFAEYSK